MKYWVYVRYLPDGYRENDKEHKVKKGRKKNHSKIIKKSHMHTFILCIKHLQSFKIIDVKGREFSRTMYFLYLQYPCENVLSSQSEKSQKKKTPTQML